MAQVSTEVLQLNIVGMDKAKHAAMLGEAHEFIATGLLMRLGFGVSVVSVKGGPYDLIIPAFENFDKQPEKTLLIRAATRTMRQSLRFTAGARGGKNRIYLTDVKVYKYTEKHNDLIIGVDEESLNLYLMPTRHIRKWGASRSKEKLHLYKNNWNILLHWNNEFLKDLEAQV